MKDTLNSNYRFSNFHFRIIFQNMGLLNGMRETILRFDLLSCSPTLRVRGQSSYESFLGGVTSIIIMSTFITIFATSFLEVLNKVNISAATSSNDETQSQNEVTDLMFAIGIEGVQLGADARYFDIYLEQVTMLKSADGTASWSQRHVPLAPCNSSDWEFIGENFDKQFRAFEMQKMLCMTDTSDIMMKGYFGNDHYQYLSLKISACTNNSVDPFVCKSNSQISGYMTNYLSTNDFFKVKFLMVDTKITPSSTDPISKVLQKDIFLSFTDELGTKGFVNFAHYSVTTDTSLLPYSVTDTLTGSYIKEHSVATIGISSTHYVHLEFFKTTEEMVITRQVVKVDAMLSYVGGLFGLLFVLVEFFLASFSEYRYELYAAEAAFTFDESGKKIREKDFGIGTYLKYALYDWMNMFGCAPDWKAMKEIDQTREEIGAQMDIAYLFRKIRSLEKTTACLLNENKRICSMLTQEPTLLETQNERKILEFYDSLNPTPKIGASNMVAPQIDEKSPDNFIIGGDSMQNSQMDAMSEETAEISEDDEDYAETMAAVKDAYYALEADSDQLSKQIKQKIPSKVKRAIKKSRHTRKIVIEEIRKGEDFDSRDQSLEPKRFGKY